jgi:hypothetical protein
VSGAVAPPAAPEPAPAGWRAHLAAFAELRDTIVFGFSALYVLGYATWALYSSDRGLGVLPPLEGQYFLAGVVPLVILAAAYGIVRAMRPAPTESGRARSATWVKRTGWAIPVIALISLMLPRLGEASATWMMLAVNAAMFGVFILRARSGERGVIWWMVPAVLLLVIVAGGLYATRLFPFIPAEFGGPQPTCVTLDVAAASLSRETTAALGVPTGELSSAVRSAPLWLHFSGGGLLVVSRERGRPVPHVLRLHDSTVTAFAPADTCK